jgi:hypothetical protein
MVHLEGDIAPGDNSNGRSDHPNVRTSDLHERTLAGVPAESLDGYEISIDKHQQVVGESRQTRRQRVRNGR